MGRGWDQARSARASVRGVWCGMLSALVAAALLSGCSSDKPPPSPLTDYTARLPVTAQWRQDFGTPVAGQPMLAVAGRLVLATARGEVVILNAVDGKLLQRADVGAKLSVGVGSDGRRSAVVTQNNELVVVEGEQVLWKARLATSVTTPPLVAGDRVFVQMADRAVDAYDAQDGRRLWAFPRSGDPLALSAPGVLMAYKDTLLVGVGSRLLLIDPLLGTTRGEVQIGLPRGTNEVERLADLTGPAARVGDVVCARAFQVAVSCVQPDRGALLWSRSQSGFQGVGADGDLVVGVDSTDRMTVWKRAAGDLVWSSERMRYRGLSAPAVAPQSVVVGDGQGWVHFLSRDRGETVQRLQTDGGAIVGAPLVLDGQVVVTTKRGGVFAFRLP